MNHQELEAAKEKKTKQNKTWVLEINWDSGQKTEGMGANYENIMRWKQEWVRKRQNENSVLFWRTTNI